MPGGVSGVSGVFGYSPGPGGVVCSVRCMCGVLPGPRCVDWACDPWVCLSIQRAVQGMANSDGVSLLPQLP